MENIAEASSGARPLHGSLVSDTIDNFNDYGKHARYETR